MEWTEIGTLLLAVYATILSTILAVRELEKRKRKIEITFGTNCQKVTIGNVGYRPIPLIEVVYIIDIPNLPNTLVFPVHEQDKLPVTLNDGECVVFEVPNEVQLLMSDESLLSVMALDAAKNEYRKIEPSKKAKVTKRQEKKWLEGK